MKINNDSRLKQLIIMIVVYFVVVLFSNYSFYNLTPGDEIGYTLLYFYFLLPIVTFLLSFFIGKLKNIGPIRWLLILMFGLLYQSPLLIIAFNGQDFFDIFISYYDMIYNGAIIALLGMIIGIIVRRI